MTKHNKSVRIKPEQRDIASLKQMSSKLIPILAMLFLTIVVTLLYYYLGNMAESIATLSLVTYPLQRFRRHQSWHAKIPPTAMIASSLALQQQNKRHKQPELEKSKLIQEESTSYKTELWERIGSIGRLNFFNIFNVANAHELPYSSEPTQEIICQEDICVPLYDGQSDNSPSSSTSSQKSTDKSTLLPALSWEGKTVYVFPDKNHTDVENHEKIINSIVKQCHASPDDCLVVLEGNCYSQGERRYITRTLLSAYSSITRPPQGIIYEFAGPKACAGTDPFFAAPRASQELSSRLAATVQKLIRNAKEIEKRCRKTLKEKHCGFPPDWFNDIEKEWNKTSSFQKCYQAEIVLKIVNTINIVNDIHVTNISDKRKLNELKANNELLRSEINELFNSEFQATIKEGDMAAIAAINSVRNQLPDVSSICLCIGISHLEQGRTLTTYLETIMQEGAKVRMITPTGVNKPFRPYPPAPVSPPIPGLPEQLDQMYDMFERQNYGVTR